MSRILVQRTLAPDTPVPSARPITPEWCPLALRVRLLQHQVSPDGRQHTYVFEAPDAETVRALFHRLCPVGDVIRVRVTSR